MSNQDFYSIDVPDMSDNTDYIVTNTTTSTGTVTIDSSYDWNNISISPRDWEPSVKIEENGITMDESADLQIGDRSLKEFMSRVEERLNILRPNSELEDRWNELAELGKQYRKLEAEILEKEKMWKILKDDK